MNPNSTETQYLSKILTIIFSSSSSFLPTRISEEVGKDIITLVSQIRNVFLKEDDMNANAKNERSETMEQATIDYYELIFFEVVKRNPEKFVGLIKPFIDSRSNQRWITTEELCEAIGTSSSSWHKSEVRNHPVVVAARRTDTRPYKYQASMIDEIQRVWDGRRKR